DDVAQQADHQYPVTVSLNILIAQAGRALGIVGRSDNWLLWIGQSRRDGLVIQAPVAAGAKVDARRPQTLEVGWGNPPPFGHIFGLRDPQIKRLFLADCRQRLPPRPQAGLGHHVANIQNIHGYFRAASQAGSGSPNRISGMALSWSCMVMPGNS